MTKITDLKIEIYADGAHKDEILALYQKPYVKGFTTNPSLVRQAGVKDYAEFAKDVLKSISDRPISFEVFADDHPTMLEQALKISSWGKNVFVKIPVCNTMGESSAPLIQELSKKGVKLNVTALFTEEQVRSVHEALDPNTDAIISIFAGRIADTGRDPMPLMKKASEIVANTPKIKNLWASSRELFNIFQAEECGTQIITVTSGILKKLDFLGKDLNEMSHDTVKAFYHDAQAAQYQI